MARNRAGWSVQLLVIATSLTAGCGSAESERITELEWCDLRPWQRHRHSAMICNTDSGKDQLFGLPPARRIGCLGVACRRVWGRSVRHHRRT